MRDALYTLTTLLYHRRSPSVAASVATADCKLGINSTHGRTGSRVYNNNNIKLLSTSPWRFYVVFSLSTASVWRAHIYLYFFFCRRSYLYTHIIIRTRYYHFSVSLNFVFIRAGHAKIKKMKCITRLCALAPRLRTINIFVYRTAIK